MKLIEIQFNVSILAAITMQHIPWIRTGNAFVQPAAGVPISRRFQKIPVVSLRLSPSSKSKEQTSVQSIPSPSEILPTKLKSKTEIIKEQTIKKKIIYPSSSSSPAAQFGKPLSPKISNFNKAAISFVKNSVFDTLFPPEDLTSTSSNENDLAILRSKFTRTYARFYALETIARMPYFAYLSVLHLYETLGWFRKSNYLKLHFSESWNELHHLLIMEELGGNEEWKDRFVAQHTAFFYYWFIVSTYLVNPILAYNLNHAVEEHAFDTYDVFLKENEQYLKEVNAPQVAKDYYTGEDLYLLSQMQTNQFKCEQGQVQFDDIRTFPIKCETLYDTFCAIRDDEAEHVKTMAFLQNQSSDIDLVLENGEACEIDPDELRP